MPQFTKRGSGLYVPGGSGSIDGWHEFEGPDRHYAYFEDNKGGVVKVRKVGGGDNASAVVTQVVATADGPTYTNSVTETSLLPAPAVFSIPGNTMYVGKTYRIIARGEIATGASPGNLTFRVRYGSATGGVIISDTGAVAMTASIATKFMWRIEVEFTCRATGSGTSGSLFGEGEASGMTSVTPVILSAMGSAGVSAPLAVGVDTTTTTTLQVTALTSAAVAATQLILHYYSLEALN